MPIRKWILLPNNNTANIVHILLGLSFWAMEIWPICVYNSVLPLSTVAIVARNHIIWPNLSTGIRAAMNMDHSGQESE